MYCGYWALIRYIIYKYFLSSVGCPFIFLVVFFEEQFLTLMKYNLPISSFVTYGFGVSHLTQENPRCISVFHWKGFIVIVLWYMRYICSFFYMIGGRGSKFIFLHVDIWLVPALFVERIILSSFNNLRTLLKSIDHSFKGLCLVQNSITSIYMSFLYQYHTVLKY
jgi:hypothetical protein